MVIGVDEKERRRKERNKAKADREQATRDEYARRREVARRSQGDFGDLGVGLTAAIIRQREVNARAEAFRCTMCGRSGIDPSMCGPEQPLCPRRQAVSVEEIGGTASRGRVRE